MKAGTRSVIFDFDGVICDSTRECLFMTALTQESREKNLPPAELLKGFSLQQMMSNYENLPFRQAFEKHRKYVRWPKEYWFILDAWVRDRKKVESVGLSQADFDGFVANTPPEALLFEKQFFSTRDAVREKDFSGWISFFDVYSDVIEGLKEFIAHQELIILTGRDSASTHAVLCASGLDATRIRIFDAKTYKNKTAGMKEILSLLKINPRDVAMIDDNIQHLAELHELGVHGIWAKWGYVCDEHWSHPHVAHVTACERAGWKQVVTTFLSV
jgi:phosphoglycolate phosphatase-like HAD superfamily hydrolase